MNKVFFYTGIEIADIDFIFFNAQGVLQETVSGVLNEDGVWEALVPVLVPGHYVVVVQYESKVLGKEDIEWDGVQIISSTQSIANAVKTELASELSHLVSLENGLTIEQAIMLLELYRLMGLDPSRPLLVTRSERTVLPEIQQTFVGDEDSTTVTRIL